MEIEIAKFWHHLWTEKKRLTYVKYHCRKIDLEKLTNGVSAKFTEHVFSSAFFKTRGSWRFANILFRTKLSIKWISENAISGNSLFEKIMDYGEKNRLDEYVKTMGLPKVSKILKIINFIEKYQGEIVMKNFLLSLEYLIREHNFTFAAQ